MGLFADLTPLSALTNFEGKRRSYLYGPAGAEAPTCSDTSCESYAVRGVCVKKEMKTHKVCGALAHNI